MSLVVPAFDEEEIIEDAIDLILDAGTRWRSGGLIDSFELVVVDDGSGDATPRLLDIQQQRHPELVVVRRSNNGGLGAALRTGFAVAGGTHVVYTDADMPFDLDALDSVLVRIGSGEAGVFRAVRRSRRGTGARRFAYSLGYQWLIAAVFGRSFYDVNFAGKVVPVSVLRGMDLRSDGSFIDAEILLRAADLGVPIRQFEIDYRPRVGGRSTLSSPSVILVILKELSAMRVERPRRLAGRDRSRRTP